MAGIFNDVLTGSDAILTNNTAYAVICGGTTVNDVLQSVASVGNSGDVLTSAGAGALPTFNAPAYVTTYIVDSTAGAAPYQTIQSALNAVGTDAVDARVIVRPGTYNENLTFPDQNVTLEGDRGGNAIIVGTHTPSNTNNLELYNLQLQSATDIFNSAGAGSGTIEITGSFITVTNGYVYNLPNWTGTFLFDDCGEASTNDGVVNNTGGATIKFLNTEMGAGSGKTMILTGNANVRFDTCNINCPVSIAGTGTFIFQNGCKFANTVTIAGTKSGTCINSSFLTGANQALVYNSGSTGYFSDVTFDSTNNPAIGGTGTIEFGQVSFLSDENIAGTLTVTYTTVTETGTAYLQNISFDRGASLVDTNGQLIIGSTGNNPQVGNLTSTGATLTITNGAGTINLEASATTPLSFPTDSGTATPAANALTIAGSHGLNTSGAAATVTVAIDNAITLGDLSGIASGSDALTCTTGDITISSGNFNLPTTSDADNGVIEVNGIAWAHSYGTKNTFIGSSAGNFTHAGNNNVVLGDDACKALTSGYYNVIIGSQNGILINSGYKNTSIGYEALKSLTGGNTNTAVGTSSQVFATGNNNTTLGAGSMYQASGNNNVAIGVDSLWGSGAGENNCAVGYKSINANNGADYNAALGYYSLLSCTTGQYNTGIGYQSLQTLTTGSYNASLGANAGSSLTTTDSDNILISNTGTAGDNNAIRIGTQGSGSGQQNTAYMAGITGVSVVGYPVILDPTTGQLGQGNGSIVKAQEEAGATLNLLVNNLYTLNRGTAITATLPATAAVGDTIELVGYGAGGWIVAQNAGQTIHIAGSNTTTGVGGSLASTSHDDCVKLVCVVANTDFVASAIVGNITVT